MITATLNGNAVGKSLSCLKNDYYVIHCYPHLDPSEKHQLRVFNGSKCILDTQIEPNPDNGYALLDRFYSYFETHAIAQDEAQKIASIYFQFDPHLGSIVVDMSVDWFPAQFGSDRFQGVPFFPPDVDPTKYGVKVDTKRVPQRSPLWFKLRGQVTGTKAYTLIGYWVPKNDPNWRYDAEPVFTEQQRKNMLFGQRSEDYAIMSYMRANNEVCVSLVGWCPCASPPFPLQWGASPDAILRNDNMRAEHIPDDVYVCDWDPKVGVLEIKSSEKSLACEGWYIIQCYMEMFATQTMWCDLLRYTPCKGRVYRVWRYREIEGRLIELLKYASRNTERLARIVHHDQRFIDLREYFSDLADNLPYTEIDVVPDLFSQYENYKIRT